MAGKTCTATGWKDGVVSAAVLNTNAFASVNIAFDEVMKLIQALRR